ncbi:hypothetical protein J6590_001870 [Homalodisca vitripennis]|nr:hypothetical protein J6590_100901 [Homalodisca vitripennis]KAG8313402.1 hypothetical protein J6590_001870 [Homalodisca vitripennis]
MAGLEGSPKEFSKSNNYREAEAKPAAANCLPPDFSAPRGGLVNSRLDIDPATELRVDAGLGCCTAIGQLSS